VLVATVRLLITKDSHAHDRTIVVIEDAVIVDEHAPGEVPFRLALHLNMDQHPGVAAIAPPDLHQRVGQATAQIGIPCDLLQFLIKQIVRTAPVDRRMRLREEEGEGVGQVAGERLLPGAVVVGGWRRLVTHAGQCKAWMASRVTVRVR
jgi:hypothetical protein